MASFHADLVFWLKYVAVFVFVAMGVSLLRSKIETINLPNQLTRPGMLAGLFAGILVILGNLALALMFDHVSKMLNSPILRQRINRITGVVLICVGGLIFIS